MEKHMDHKKTLDAANKKSIAFGYRRVLLVLIDVACYLVAFSFNILITALSGTATRPDWRVYGLNLLVSLVALFAGRLFTSVYRHAWRYPNVRANMLIVLSDTVFGVLAIAVTKTSDRMDIGFWRSFSVLCLFTLMTLFNRFGYQLYHQWQNAKDARRAGGGASMNKIGVAIVGAGQVGVALAEQLLHNAEAHYRPLCFIDCDSSKIGARISGLKVYAEEDDVIEILKQLPVQEIIVAIPGISPERAAEIHAFYIRTGCKIKMYDYPFRDADTLDKHTSGNRVLRDFQIEDLLFRDLLAVSDEATQNYYRDKTILVTGGGGSIGSEICRQLAKCHPAKLIIVDIYENNAYDIQQDLIRKYGDRLDLSVEIASVRDVDRLDSIFRAYRPDVVFHAAAHKHVPLMEHSSAEAIKNNVMGTYNTANVAEKYGVKKFVLVSTDKAVNPTNIMGASKRMCEMVIQCRTDSKTSFAAVRFGNVLGSNGSVIPLFREQIRRGGPVTLTDKRIIRYFMTIPEASQLVMQAGAMAKSGELFVLDMGKPVKILELAENMIRLSGYKPYEDIDIVEIGLRPGEKLYEELLMKSETLAKTDNDLIFIEKDTPFTRAEVEEKLNLLRAAVEEAKTELAAPRIKAAMHAVVPTYHDPEEVNCRFDTSEEKKRSEKMATV